MCGFSRSTTLESTTFLNQNRSEFIIWLSVVLHDQENSLVVLGRSLQSHWIWDSSVMELQQRGGRFAEITINDIIQGFEKYLSTGVFVFEEQKWDVGAEEEQ